MTDADERAGVTPDRDRPVVLVLGGGFGGLGAARSLKRADAEVVLVDAHDYHTFQPMLYQLATALIEPAEVAHPLRDLFHDQPNATVHQATVSAIDLAARRVELEEMPAITYDYLVLAIGAEVSFFGVEGAAEHAFPMYTLNDALRLKDHVLRRWEAADRDPSLVEDGALHVVVVGGGPTGVESVGALAELYRSNFAKDYPSLPADEARLTLVEAAPSLFTMFEPDLQEYAHGTLESWDVEVLLNEVVESVTPKGVTLKSGRELRAHTLVWGAGLRAHSLAKSLGLELEHGNRIPVDDDLTIAGHPEVYAVGDIAWITDAKTGEVLPQLGSVALQAGEHAGENIARRLAGKSTEPFRYHDKGTMATIGRGAAVIQLPHGRTVKGRTAFLAWGAVHLALLSSGEDRTKAVLDWVWAGFTRERGGRVVVGTDEED
ncbi:MAG TPA: NAD(P)/FAD-dependent oxidoreductase [Solirubrobacterales bacterium]|nr:NAD(P)/FAD-dependent oxidoreductase [Solirubrobacterales bacterium]